MKINKKPSAISLVFAIIAAVFASLALATYLVMLLFKPLGLFMLIYSVFVVLISFTVFIFLGGWALLIILYLPLALISEELIPIAMILTFFLIIIGILLIVAVIETLPLVICGISIFWGLLALVFGVCTLKRFIEERRYGIIIATAVLIAFSLLTSIVTLVLSVITSGIYLFLAVISLILLLFVV